MYPVGKMFGYGSENEAKSLFTGKKCGTIEFCCCPSIFRHSESESENRNVCFGMMMGKKKLQRERQLGKKGGWDHKMRSVTGSRFLIQKKNAFTHVFDQVFYFCFVWTCLAAWRLAVMHSTVTCKLQLWHFFWGSQPRDFPCLCKGQASNITCRWWNAPVESWAGALAVRPGHVGPAEKQPIQPAVWHATSVLFRHVRWFSYKKHVFPSFSIIFHYREASKTCFCRHDRSGGVWGTTRILTSPASQVMWICVHSFSISRWT